MNARPSLLSRAWLIVALLWVVAAFNYLDRNMITTMRLSLEGAIPMDDAQFGLLTSSFLWVYAVLSPFAGFLADRFSRSGMIVGSLLCWSSVTWLTGHAQNFEQLLIARSLMGVSEACYIPAALALIADYHRGPTRSLATGIHMSGIMVGAGLGGIGGWLAEHHGWAYSFHLLGTIGVCYAVMLAVVLRDPPRDGVTKTDSASANHINFLESLFDLLRRPSFVLLLVYWGLLGLVGWAVVGWLPTYLNVHFHLSQGKAGLTATGYVQAAMLVGVLLGGYWADRWSRTNERGRIWVPAIGLFLAAPGILLASMTSLIVPAIAGLVVYGLARSFSDSNMMPILCMVVDPRHRATGYGVLNFFGCVVGGLAIYAGGALKDANVDLSRVFQVAAATLVICGALLLLVKSSPEKDVTEELSQTNVSNEPA